MAEGWDHFAELRQHQIETGLDLTFSKVFVPLYEELLSEYKPVRVLEIGAGTGHLAKTLHTHTSLYTALEPSRGMYSVSMNVLAEEPIDLKQQAVETLNAGTGYDMALAHLVLQTISGHFRIP